MFYALVGGGKVEKSEQEYRRLCEHLNRARRAGMIPFGDLRDDGVVVMSRRCYDGVEGFHDDTARRAREYQRDRQAGQPQRIELWCEYPTPGGILRAAEEPDA